MIPAPISAGFSDVANYSPLMQTSSEKEVFRTELVEKPSSWKIDHSKHLLFLGSCFSENIGELSLVRDLRFSIKYVNFQL